MKFFWRIRKKQKASLKSKSTASICGTTRALSISPTTSSKDLLMDLLPTVRAGPVYSISFAVFRAYINENGVPVPITGYDVRSVCGLQCLDDANANAELFAWRLASELGANVDELAESDTLPGPAMDGMGCLIENEKEKIRLEGYYERCHALDEIGSNGCMKFTIYITGENIGCIAYVTRIGPA